MVRVAGDNVGASSENQYKAMMEKEVIDAFSHSEKGDKGYEWLHRTSGYAGWSTIENHLNDVEKSRKEQVGKEALRTPELMTALQSPDGKSQGDFWKQLADKDGKITPDKLDDYIKQSKAQQTLPDQFNPQDADHTKYNQQWLKAAEQLKSHTEQLRNGDSVFLGMGNQNNIDQESLAKGLGYRDAAQMLGENKKAEAAPVGDQTNNGGNQQPADLASRSDAILKSVATLPDADMQPILKNGLTKDGVQKLLDGDSKDHNLTVNQRDTFTKLRDDWDKVVGAGKPVDVNGMAHDAQDPNKPSEATNHLKETATKAQDGLSKLNGADLSALVDDKGNITKDKVDAYLAQKPDGMSDDDYNKGKERAQFIKDNFNDMSHDGTTISHDNMKQYAASMGAGADKYQDYSDKPGATDQGPDQATKDAQAKVDGLKQSEQLHKGEHVFDMAKRVLEERAKLTGEATDNNAVMREVARLCISNGIGKPEVLANLQKRLDDPAGKVSDSNLPKELNYLRYGQEIKTYTDADKAKYVDAIKKKAAPESNPNPTGRPDNYADTGETQ
jgi:hypothetical protein